MANILIVSGSYFPNATANAVCVKKFEDALKSKKHKTLYCNRKNNLYEPDFYIYEGTELFTVGKNSDLFFQTITVLSNLNLPGKMSEDFSKAIFFYRILSGIHKFGKNKKQIRQEAREHYLKSYGTRIAQLVRDKSIDLILSVSMPFDSHMAVLEAMDKLSTKRRPRWIAYCIDAYWSKDGMSIDDIPRMKEEEARVFRSCDQILLLDVIERDYCGSEFDIVRNKIQTLPLPLFDLDDIQKYNNGIPTRDDVVEVVYTGTIYDNSSNIDVFTNVAEMLRGEKIRFHFIGKISPKSMSILEKLQQKMPEQVLIYGRKPYDYAKGSMQRADILLNLANNNANQIPSKIFEYMMCLKPILNIYGVQDDIGTEYLKKYPLAFSVYKEDDISTERILSWVRQVQKEIVSKEEIEEKYKTILSASVCEKFCKSVDILLS